MYKDEHRAQVGDDESNTEHEQELGVGSDKILNSPVSDCEGLGVRLVDGIIVIIYHTCMTGF